MSSRADANTPTNVRHRSTLRTSGLGLTCEVKGRGWTSFLISIEELQSTRAARGQPTTVDSTRHSQLDLNKRHSVVTAVLLLAGSASQTDPSARHLPLPSLAQRWSAECVCERG